LADLVTSYTALVKHSELVLVVLLGTVSKQSCVLLRSRVLLILTYLLLRNLVIESLSIAIITSCPVSLLLSMWSHVIVLVDWQTRGIHLLLLVSSNINLNSVVLL
jgi:hypothetical protein